MKTRQILAILIAAGVLLSATNVQAAARTASVSGLWSSTATWGGLSVPVAADTVTINTGINVTGLGGSNQFCTSIVINGTGTLTVDSNTLTLSGNITVGSGGGSNARLTIDSGAAISVGTTFGFNGTTPAIINNGTFSCAGGGTFSTGSITNNGTANFTGSAQAFNGSTAVIQGTNAVLNITANNSTPFGGSSTLTASAPGNTVSYTAGQNMKGATYFNLSVSGNSPSAGASTIVNGTLRINLNSGQQVNSANNITMGPNSTILRILGTLNGTPVFPAGPNYVSVIYANTVAMTTGTELPANIKNLTLTNTLSASSANKVTLNTSTTVNGTFAATYLGTPAASAGATVLAAASGKTVTFSSSPVTLNFPGTQLASSASYTVISGGSSFVSGPLGILTVNGAGAPAGSPSVAITSGTLVLTVAAPVTTYTVNYDANGGTGSQTDGSSPYVSGASVTVLGTGSISRTGYTFSHWNTASDDTGTSFAPTDTFNIAANATLYAIWTINNYSVSYDGNGNDGGSAPGTQNGNYNTSVTAAANTFTRTGYSFTGWNMAADGSGLPVAAGASYTIPPANTTLYAQWSLGCTTPNIVGGIDASATTLCAGSPVILTLTNVTSSEPLFYQWQTNNVDIEGATNASYTNLTVALADGADYTCVVSNDCGSTTSAVVTLTVNPLPAAPTAGDVMVTYDGAVHTGAATPAVGSGVKWFTAASGGSETTAPSATTAGTYTAYAAATNDTTGCESAMRTLVTVQINKADASVVVTPYNVVYDGNPQTAIVGTVTGVNGETGATVGTVDLSGTTHTAAGSYPGDSWTLTGGANYNDISATTISNNIAKATASVVNATADSKVYDGNASATIVSRTLTGVIAPDDVTLSGGTASFADKNVGIGKAVTVTGMVLGGADMANYTLASGDANTTADIGARPLAVAALASNKAYDGNAEATVSLSDNRILGDVLTISHAAAAFDNKNVGTAKPVSVSGISMTGTDAGNYSLANTTAVSSADITGRSLAVTAVASNKVYDGNTGATVTLSDDRISGDVLTVIHAAASFDDKNVGAAKPVSVSGVSMTGADAGNYNLANTTAASSADITVASLVASATADHKVYDGTTAATIATRSLTGVIAPDDVTLTGGTASFGDKNVGSGKAVSVIGMVLGGANMANYTLASGNASTTADITVASLAASATANNKVYDGTMGATIATRSLTGVIAPDDVTLSGGAASFADKSAGIGKAVTVTGLVLGGADMANYTLASGDANTTADIMVRPLAIAALASNKAYDGNADATVSLSDNRILNDVLTASHAAAAFDNKNVGPAKPVSVSGISMTGTDAGNYSLANTTAASSADITARALTVSALAANKVYDGNVDASATLSDDRIGGDGLTISHTTAAFDNKNVGMAKLVSVSGISMTGTDAGNYNLANTTVASSADITARLLAISATAQSKVYDGNTNVVVSLADNRVSGDVLTAANTDAGFEDANVSTAKTVNIFGLSLSGTDAGNYSLASMSTTATADITAVQLTVTADNQSRAYGAMNPALTATIAGFVNNEANDVIFGSAELTTLADTNSPTGSYPITAALGTLSATNYTFSLVDGLVTITPYALTVAADNHARTYGAPNPTLTGSLVGLQNGDDITASYATSADAASPVGPYPITVALADPNGRLVNYSVTTNNGTLTISAATLTVIADNQTRGYGAANPILTATISGFVNDENASIVTGSAAVSTLADEASTVGSYPIAAALGTLSTANYAFSFAAGFLEITAASLTPNITANSKVYDGNNSAAIATRSLTGVIGADDVSLIGGTASFADKNAGIGKAVAATGLSLSGAAAGNYALATTTANTLADITPASLAASATVNNKVYDATTAATIASRSLTGVIAPDDVTISGGTASFADKNLGNGKVVSVTGLVLGGADMGNYSLASGDANTTANILARSLTVTADDQSRNYGEPNPTLTGTLSGTIAGDNITASYATLATIASPAGAYDITPALNDPNSNLGNYVVTINNGTLTILSLTPSTIGSIEQRADGNMHILVYGTPGQVYHLQAIGDLSGSIWSNISTNTANGLGVVEFDDLSATNHTSRFYRVSTP
jgi:uncharacterized repeat protein (TIGR02543 family)